jgi:hypothetical protein
MRRTIVGGSTLFFVVTALSGGWCSSGRGRGCFTAALAADNDHDDGEPNNENPAPSSSYGVDIVSGLAAGHLHSWPFT